MIDLRPIALLIGYLLGAMAVAMLVPAMVDAYYDDLDWLVFLASALVTGFVALALVFGHRTEAAAALSIRQAFLLTTLAWLAAGLFGALPFMFSALDMTITDAVFESISGLTTTGSTVLSGLDTMPRGILLWRSTLQWLGGIGIIVMAVAILPVLKIGGMQLFKMESSDKTEKIKPRIRQVASGIAIAYVSFTILCAIALWLVGMTPFEAVNHAMTTLATGGYSTSDGSLGHFGPAAQWIVTIFMAVGGTTFVLFLAPRKKGKWTLLADSQFRWFIAFLGFFTALLAAWQWAVNDWSAHDSLRHAAFNVVSVVTTTGFASTDYSLWGGFPQVAFFVLTFIGGCTGSTSGGIKIFRWEVLFAMARVHLKRLIHPHGVFVIDFNKQRISDQVVKSVLGFMVLYFLTFAGLTLALTMTGLDAVTALTGAATSISNVGPGLGDIIGPAGNFEPLPDPAKWVCVLGMVLGRLELFTVLVLFTRSFWKE